MSDETSSQRLSRIAELHGETLLQAILRRDPKRALHQSTAMECVGLFAAADPSRNKSATQWLVQTYIKGSFLLEDLGKARDTLTWFGLYKRKLPVEARDLNRYSSLGQVWKAVEPMVLAQLPASNRDEERLLRESVRQQTTILVERNDGLKIVIPETVEAAKWWGRGTRWCTAADEDNLFADYAEESPLLVIVMPNGDKLQMWAGESDFQFMDAADDPVSTQYIEEHWGILEPLMRWAVQANPETLREVPESLMDEEMYSEALSKAGWLIQCIPEEQLTYEHCLSALLAGGATRFIPDHLWDQALTEAAVRNDATAYPFLPDEFKTPEVAVLAMENHPDIAELLPALRKVPGYAEKAARCTPFTPYFLSGMLTEELAFELVRENPKTFSLIHHELKTKEMCLMALAADPRLIGWVPEKMMTQDICNLAVSLDRSAIFKVPAQFTERMPQEWLEWRYANQAQFWVRGGADTQPEVDAWAEGMPERLVRLHRMVPRHFLNPVSGITEERQEQEAMQLAL